MVKNGKKSKKKGEFFFNFKKLRQRLNSKQKEKLTNFFGNFRTMFLKVKEHLFQVNKMYDLMEQEYKKFQKDLFKNDEYLSCHKEENKEDDGKSKKEGEEFFLDEDAMKQIFGEDLKDKKDNKNENLIDKSLFDKYGSELEKDCEEIDKEKKKEKKEEINTNEFKQEFFDWREKNK